MMLYFCLVSSCLENVVRVCLRVSVSTCVCSVKVIDGLAWSDLSEEDYVQCFLIVFFCEILIIWKDLPGSNPVQCSLNRSFWNPFQLYCWWQPEIRRENPLREVGKFIPIILQGFSTMSGGFFPDFWTINSTSWIFVELWVGDPNPREGGHTQVIYTWNPTDLFFQGWSFQCLSQIFQNMGSFGF